MKQWAVAALLSAFAGSVWAQGTYKVPGGGGGGGTEEQGSNPAIPTGKYRFYLGADYDWLTLSVSDSSSSGGFPVDNYSSRIYDVRVGYRVFDRIGVEFHYGIKAQDGDQPGTFGVDHYYGVFVAPTGTVLNTVELSALVGYTWDSVTQAVPGQMRYHKAINSAAFGANLEFPIKVISDSLPNIRIGGGGIVTVQRVEQRIYGFHVGLRYDFGL